MLTPLDPRKILDIPIWSNGGLLELQKHHLLDHNVTQSFLENKS